jgi:peptidoglycan/LPS O-acetylase OafA/YrhL
LSAFLLTLPFIKEGRAAWSKDFLLSYAFRRFFRIYPLYFVFLLCGLVTSLVVWKVMDLDEPVGIPFTLSIREFFDHLLLIRGKGLTWSIIVEFRYYFVLPLAALTYSIIFKNKLLPSILLTVALVAVCQLIWPQSASWRNDPRLGPYLAIFLMGSLLAVIFNWWKQSPWIHDKRAAMAIEAAGILAAATLFIMIPSVASVLLGKPLSSHNYHKYFILMGFLWSLVLFSCLAGSGLLRKIFEIPLLRYFGFISFSIYLLHGIVLSLVKKLGGHPAALGWAVVIATIAVSHVSWLLIEKPTSRWRLPKSTSKAPPAAAPQPIETCAIGRASSPAS